MIQVKYLKKAIILTSFGVIDSKIRQLTMDTLKTEIQSNFTNFKVVQAYTSNFIRQALKNKGVSVFSIKEQIKSLNANGFDKIIILPSHLTPGEEFENKIKPLASSNVEVLTPVFTLESDTDFDLQALKIMIDCFKTTAGETLVLIGHGSPHQHNPVYENLQKLADIKNFNIHIGVIEPNDTPNFNDVLQRLQRDKVKKILIAPMLFNGGSHVAKDIAGDNPDSWKNRLIAEGFNVRVCKEGLGSFKKFRQLYIDKLNNVLYTLH